MLNANGNQARCGRRFLWGMLALALPLGLSLLCLSPTYSDDAPEDDKSKEKQADEASERLKFMLDSMGEYQVEVQDADGQTRPSSMQPTAALRWTNTVSGTRDGIAAVWSSGGRPDVVVQFGGFGTNWNFHFESTSLGPLTMTRKGVQVWAPKTGIVLKALPNAPAAANTAAKRMIQMREIAERFEITDDFHPKYVEEKTERHVLRLLSKPLFRYEPAGDLIDGAVFGFVIATDPEALLMVEAVKTKDRTEWRYALKPMTVYVLKAKLDDNEIWDSPDNRFRRWQRDDSCYVGPHF